MAPPRSCLDGQACWPVPAVLGWILPVFLAPRFLPTSGQLDSAWRRGGPWIDWPPVVLEPERALLVWVWADPQRHLMGPAWKVRQIQVATQGVAVLPSEGMQSRSGWRVVFGLSWLRAWQGRAASPAALAQP